MPSPCLVPLLRKLIASLCVVACGTLAAGCSDQHGADAVARLEECRVEGFELAVRCGQIRRAEDAAHPQARTLVLNFVVSPALARNKLPDPVFVLAGGPGQSAIDIAPVVMPIFAGLNKRRDIVFVDQRGTGRSHALACKTPEAPPLSDLVDPDAQVRQLSRCWKSLDADTRMYTTEIAMRDLDAVRAQLGFERINLWGGSYGTRAALDYMRQFGPHVRSAVIDGVAPADMALPASMAVDADRLLRQVQAACARDVACAQAYPKFSLQLDDWLADLKASPLKIKAADPLTGTREPMRLSHDSVLGLVRAPLYAAPVAALLPLALQEAQTGNVDPLLVLGASAGGAMEDKFSFGMHLSVLCAEDVPQLDTPAQQPAVAAAQATRFGTMFIDAYRSMCAQWPAGTPDAAFFSPLRTDIPVLLLSGGADPVTPPRHAQAVLEGLSRGKHLVAENIGHGVSSAGCGPDLVDKFIRAGNADALDGACLQQIPRPPFLLPVKPGKRAHALPAKAAP